MLSQKGILAISTTMAAAALAIAISTAAYVANQPEDTGKRLDFTEKEPTIVGNELAFGVYSLLTAIYRRINPTV